MIANKVSFQLPYSFIHVKEVQKNYKKMNLHKIKKVPKILNPNNLKDIVIYDLKNEIPENHLIALHDFSEKNEMITIGFPLRFFSTNFILKYNKIKPVSRMYIHGKTIQITLSPENEKFKKEIAEIIRSKHRNLIGITTRKRRKNIGEKNYDIEYLYGPYFFAILFKENFSYFALNYNKTSFCTTKTRERLMLLNEIKGKGHVIAIPNGEIDQTAIPAIKKGYTVVLNEYNINYRITLKNNLTLNGVSNNKNYQLFDMHGYNFMHMCASFYKIDHFIIEDAEDSFNLAFPLQHYTGIYCLHLYFFCPYWENPVEYANQRIWLNVTSADLRKARKNN
ncbi:hypothetical protein EDEG_00618 [Edhazardia aedis USNM 41457]|uniref:Uncharacterized protein n=1 Tax=Edhazardia aedis (strain USNM 41457) TaxID=1003232 RepID=J9DRW4_EDHAE|nr:hypothetical protein EDEG_00618 [Edhazardia aedis USNM 41457]|eukprot:EJW05315.1 hypothetical protein EDEG_00618 [Edhazardia aedis USNM 41457]